MICVALPSYEIVAFEKPFLRFSGDLLAMTVEAKLEGTVRYKVGQYYLGGKGW